MMKILRWAAAFLGVTLVGAVAWSAGAPESAAAAQGPLKFSIALRAPPEIQVDPQKNEYIAALNSRANVDITWTILGTTNWLDKRNLLIASGDLPDVIMMDFPGNMSRLDSLYFDIVSSGTIIPLDGYLSGAPNLMKYTLASAWESCRDPKDGKTYMVPRCTIVREDFWAIRKDWRQKLGIPELVTLDDWRKFARAVTFDDPDGNGKADTFGVYLNLSSYGEGDYFARAYHADNQWRVGPDGKVFLARFARDGRYKEALSFFQALVKDGSMDPESLTEKVHWKRFQDGAAAGHATFVGNLDSNLIPIRKVQPTAELELVDFPVAPGGVAYNDRLVQRIDGVYYTWAITKAAKDRAERIVKFFDWMIGDEGWFMANNGAEGVHYTMSAGKVVRTEKYSAFANDRGWLMMFRQPNDENFWLTKAIPEYYDYEKQWLPRSIDYISKNYVGKGLIGYFSPEEQAFQKTDFYQTKLLETWTRIIWNQLPVSEWDKVIDEAYKSGWGDVEKAFNAYFAAHK